MNGDGHRRRRDELGGGAREAGVDLERRRRCRHAPVDADHRCPGAAGGDENEAREHATHLPRLPVRTAVGQLRQMLDARPAARRRPTAVSMAVSPRSEKPRIPGLVDSAVPWSTICSAWVVSGNVLAAA